MQVVKKTFKPVAMQPVSVFGLGTPLKRTHNQRRSLYNALVENSAKHLANCVKHKDSRPWYDAERDAYIMPLDGELKMGHMVPWDTTDQWFRLKDLRDAWGPSCAVNKYRNLIGPHTGSVECPGSMPLKDRNLDYRFWRNDINMISQAQRVALAMGWALTYDQKRYLLDRERGK